jgi:hypothetical protein
MSHIAIFSWCIFVGVPSKNVIHVSVAGTVGTFWYAPNEATSFCSPAVTDSFNRAVTFSFGSICLGSLLVAIIQVLHQLIRNARRNQRDGLLLCILECLVSLHFSFWRVDGLCVCRTTPTAAFLHFRLTRLTGINLGTIGGIFQ